MSEEQWKEKMEALGRLAEQVERIAQKFNEMPTGKAERFIKLSDRGDFRRAVERGREQLRKLQEALRLREALRRIGRK